MNRVTLLLLSLVMTMGSACSEEQPPRTDIPLAAVSVAPESPRERNSAARILTGRAVCSATKLAPQVLLSASHCFRTARNLLIVDNELAKIERILQDGNDHALVLLSEIEMQDFAVWGPPPKEGDNIHYWGNPHVFDMLLRRGYVSGFKDVDTLYDVNGYHGDSGAGVFNDKKQLVGVISYIQGLESFAMMGSYPLNFTAEQLAIVGLKPEPRLMTGVKATVNLVYSD